MVKVFDKDGQVLYEEPPYTLEEIDAFNRYIDDIDGPYAFTRVVPPKPSPPAAQGQQPEAQPPAPTPSEDR